MSAPQRTDKTQARMQNEAQLAELYEEYYDRIAHYALAHIGDRNDAEDIAGETFLKALKSIDSYQERGVPMQAWLFKIAHNLIVDYLRKKAKLRVQPIDATPIPVYDDPAAVAERNIELDRVTTAMTELTNDQREVVRLRFLGGLTSKEVAMIMNKSDGSVREMQRAAIEKLRNILAVQG
jgi:RNA polymerase sigma-70 factor (ECF subfamily)